MELLTSLQPAIAWRLVSVVAIVAIVAIVAAPVVAVVAVPAALVAAVAAVAVVVAVVDVVVAEDGIASQILEAIVDWGVAAADLDVVGVLVVVAGDRPDVVVLVAESDGGTVVYAFGVALVSAVVGIVGEDAFDDVALAVVVAVAVEE